MKKLVFLILFFLVSCHSKKETPKDFSFKVEYFTDSYDSKTQEFRRIFNYSPSYDEVKDSTLTVKIKLSDAEINEIYNSFLDNNFKSLPEDFRNINIFTKTIPETSDELTFRLNNFEKKSTFRNGVGEKPMFKGKNFEKISEKISKILYSKPEIQNLKESNIYLE